MSKEWVEPSDSLLPALGVGITYSVAIEPLLEQYPALFDVVEVEPQTTWLEARTGPEPYWVSEHVLEHIIQLPGHKLIHSVGTPVGGTVRPEPAQVALLQRTIERFNAPWISDHLSFNSTPEFKTGFFLPPRQTREGVETAVASIRALQAALSVPVAVETGVNYLRPRADEMTDGAFVAAVVETANCGLLLDLHNIFANELNGRQSVEAFLAQLPLERIWEIHLAGGFEMEGFWLDAHSGAIPAPLFEMAKQVVPTLPNLKAVIFEIYPSFVPVIGLDVIRRQMEKLHELWVLRGQTHAHHLFVNPVQTQEQIKPNDYASPAAWERTLGALVIGRAVDNEDLTGEFVVDPGVNIVHRLIREFRASMLVNVLRLTTRLLMLALNPDVFQVILNDFWAKTPPQPFASSEATAFADYLEALNLKVPQLAKVLQFERAVMATLMDDQPRVITFDLDPLPLLRALAEGHLPDIPGQPGRFEIEVTPSGPLGITNLGLETVQQSVPFH